MQWPADSGYLTKLKLDPFGSRLKVYLIYSGLVGVFFFGLYPTLNWLTSLRSTTFGLYFPFELDIPLIPAFIWLYLSMYLVFIVPVFLLNEGGLKRLAFELIIVTVAAAGIFLLLPARLGFIRVLPDTPVYRVLFEQIFMLDKPHNLVPSLHVAYSATLVLAVSRNAKPLVNCGLWLWLIGLMLSTVLTHQHHLLDVFSGAVLSLMTYQFMDKFYEKNTHSGTGII